MPEIELKTRKIRASRADLYFVNATCACALRSAQPQPSPASSGVTLFSCVPQGNASYQFQNISLAKFCTERRGSDVSTPLFEFQGHECKYLS